MSVSATKPSGYAKVPPSPPPQVKLEAKVPALPLASLHRALPRGVPRNRQGKHSHSTKQRVPTPRYEKQSPPSDRSQSAEPSVASQHTQHHPTPSKEKALPSMIVLADTTSSPALGTFFDYKTVGAILGLPPIRNREVETALEADIATRRAVKLATPPGVDQTNSDAHRAGREYFKVIRIVTARERAQSWSSPKSAGGKRSSGHRPLPFLRPDSCPPTDLEHQGSVLSLSPVSKDFSPSARAPDSPAPLSAGSPLDKQDKNSKHHKLGSSPSLLVHADEELPASPIPSVQTPPEAVAACVRVQKPPLPPAPILTAAEAAKYKPAQKKTTTEAQTKSSDESDPAPPSSRAGIALHGLAGVGRRAPVVLKRANTALL